MNHVRTILFGIFVAVSAISGCDAKSLTTGLSEKDRFAMAIKKVLELDNRIGNAGDNAIAKGGGLRSTSQAMVDEMRKIDLTKCPPDFQRAYMKHIYAWEQLPPYLSKYEGFSGGLYALFEGLSGIHDGNAEGGRLYGAIKETYHEVETIALAYGVQFRPPRTKEAGT